MDNIVTQKLTVIWHLIQQGEDSAAKQRVVNLLRDHPQLVTAWLLLAELLETKEEKSKCYRRVLELDENNDTALQFFGQPTNEKRSRINITPVIPELFDDDFIPENQPVDEVMDFDDGFEDNDYHPDVYQDNINTDNALTTYIISELGSHVDEDDTIREVSLRGQMNWYEAEKFVTEIKDKHTLLIAKRRSPLLLIIAIPTLIAGIVWFVLAAVYVIENINSSISFDLIAILIQSLRYFIGSIAMLLGGSVGIYRVLKSLGKIK